MPIKFPPNKDQTKRPYASWNYTKEQARELARCADPVNGYRYFMENYFFIQHPTKGQMLYEPFAYQEKLIETYHNYRFSVALMPRQTGKALPLDTEIPTPGGWTTMGELCVGDEILGKDGKPAKVSFATDVMINHDCYALHFDNGHSITADAEHLWEVNSNDWRTGRRVVTTLELKNILDESRKNKAVYVEINEALDLPEKALPLDPYVLGFWLGDGESAGSRYTQLHEDNLEATPKLKAAGFDLSEPWTNTGRNPRVETVNIRGLRTVLRHMNLLNNKHIPSEYLRASVEQRLELLRGLMDTDGSVDSRNGRCEFYQKNKTLIADVGELLSSLGIKYRVGEHEIDRKLYYTIGFSTDKYDVFNYTRKLTKQQQCKGHPKNKRFYITEIVSAPSVPVRCIQVDNADHMFLCSRQMIPTHNTTSAAGYLLWYSMFTSDSLILIAAHKYSGAQEIMQRIRYAYETCPDFLRAGAVSYNKGSLEWDNGSRIVAQATTENTGRGMSITLLYCDEFAFVRNTIAREFWTSMRPTLSTGGKCIITSTPNSDEDQFATIWRGANNNTDEYGNEQELGVNGFKPYRAYWHEHPDRDQAWADEEQAAIGEERFRREHGCYAQHTSITLQDTEGNIFDMEMGDLYRKLRDSQ